MKTKIMALAFSLAFLTGNAVYSEQEKDPKGPIHTLETYKVYPNKVKLLNDQILEPADWEQIIRNDVAEISEKSRQFQTKTIIAFYLREIADVPFVTATN
jgi:hypothetical protein